MSLARLECRKFVNIFLSVALSSAHDLSRLGTSLKIEAGVAGTLAMNTLRMSLYRFLSVSEGRAFWRKERPPEATGWLHDNFDNFMEAKV